ncbi:MAG: hypothetical protein MJK04_00780 [Psychrosphaera sp.]|nr:hypothetical protein [Psychrosphaera sp.]
MATANSLITKIDVLVKKLGDELAPEDIKGGWTDKRREDTTKLLTDLKVDIKAGKTIDNLSIPRGLDYWGIFSGPLLEETAILSNEYNQWVLSRNKK